MANSDFSSKIEAFWAWFVTNRALIETVVNSQNHPKTQTIVEQFDHHILDLGRFKWMLDNPTSENFTFTISPNNDSELYKKSRAIIADSPYFPNWTFYDHIQPNGLAPFEIYDAQMDVQEIDPGPWQFSLNAAGANRFDIILLQTNCDRIDLETREIAAEIAVSNLIGEGHKIDAIHSIVLAKDEATLSNQCFPLLELSRQLHKEL